MYPVEHLRQQPTRERRFKVDAIEYSVCQRDPELKYKAILNEKIRQCRRWSICRCPIASTSFPMTCRRTEGHQTSASHGGAGIPRVAAVAHERGEVSAGLRHVIVIQAVRLADLAAARLAYAEGGTLQPTPSMCPTVNSVMAEFGDADGDTDNG